MKTMTTWQDFEGEAGAAETTWAYNSAGVLESKTYADQTSTLYRYYPGGRLKERESARGIKTTYTYNTHARHLGS